MQYGHVDIVNVHISSRGGSETTPLMSKGTDEISEEAVVVSIEVFIYKYIYYVHISSL